MNHADAQPDRLHELLGCAADRGLTDAEAAELRPLLEADRGARETYAAYMLLHADLAWESAQHRTMNAKPATPSAQPIASKPRGAAQRTPGVAFRVPRFAYALAACLALAAAAVAIYLFTFNSQPETRNSKPDSAPVAVLLDASAAIWRTEPGVIGDSFGPRRLAIAAGSIEFETFAGATVVLAGPTDYELTAANRGRLHSGALIAHVEPGAHGFTIAAPHGVSVVDRGTDFAMAVDPAGATEVAVLTGSVELRRADALVRTLVAGDVVRLAPPTPAAPDAPAPVDVAADLPAPAATLAAILASDRPIATDFAAARLHPALDTANPDRFALADGVLRYVGPAETRAYLRTRRGDLRRRDWRIEATFTAQPDNADHLIDKFAAGNRVFVGLGDGVPGPHWDEANHSITFAIILADGNVIEQSTLAGELRSHATHPIDRPLYGTHRVRLTKRGDQMWLDIDLDYTPGAPFAADAKLGPMTIPDDLTLDADGAHALLGTGQFGLDSRFDDYLFTLDPPADAGE